MSGLSIGGSSGSKESEDSEGFGLKPTTIEILRTIYAEDGQTNTSVIKDRVGIDNSGSVIYRYDKLENKDLIREVQTDEQVTTVELTEDGLEYCQENFGEHAELRQVANQVQSLKEKVKKLENENQRLREVIDEQDDEISSLKGEVGDVLNSYEPEQVQQEIEQLRTKVRKQISPVRESVGALYLCLLTGYDIHAEDGRVLPRNKKPEQWMRNHFVIDDESGTVEPVDIRGDDVKGIDELKGMDVSRPTKE